MEPKSFNYMPIGRGKNCIADGEFVVTGYDSLMKAAADFITHHDGKPQQVDTGFMGIMGPVLLDPKDAGIDHQRCGYPRVVKFKLDRRPAGDIAVLLYSFDHMDVLNMQNYLNLP
ncbi:hypothetical protein D3C85_724480 [compost metagenome]